MPKKKLRESQTAMRLELNLDEILGQDVLGRPDVREAAAQKAIDIILERTSKGKFLPGSSKKGYSKEGYMKSPDFKAFRKSDVVNLKLTGQMLGTMSVVESAGNQVVIGWDDETENAKAFNHNTGDNRVPKRIFFDLTDSEIDEIEEAIKPMVQDQERPTREAREILTRAQNANNLPDELFNFGFDDDEL